MAKRKKAKWRKVKRKRVDTHPFSPSPHPSNPAPAVLHDPRGSTACLTPRQVLQTMPYSKCEMRTFVSTESPSSFLCVPASVVYMNTPVRADVRCSIGKRKRERARESQVVGPCGLPLVCLYGRKHPLTQVCTFRSTLLRKQRESLLETLKKPHKPL